MAIGCIDIYASRRRNYEYCCFWKRNEDSDIPASELVHRKEHDGSFYATEENPETLQNNMIGEAFMFDENTIVISTTDDISNLEANDVVEYDERVWNVRSVQKSKIKRRSEFSKSGQFKYYITMKC